MNKHTSDLEFFVSAAIIIWFLFALGYYIGKWLLS